MNRKEAMEMAVAIVNKECEVPTKANGYTVDGWKTPSLEQKTDAMIKLAEFLWDASDDTVSIRDKVGD